MQRIRLALVVGLAVSFGCASSEKPEKGKTEVASKDEAVDDEKAPAKSGDGSSKAEGPTDEKPPSGKHIEIASDEPPKIELVDAGAEPREALRLTVEQGTEETFSMTMHMTMAMKVGPNAAPAVALPAMVTTMKSKVDAATDDQLDVSHAIVSVDLQPADNADPAMVDAMRAQLEGLQDFTAQTAIDRRGVLRSGSITVPSTLTPQLQQTLEQLGTNLGQIQIPFPDEPVGIGAKWTATSQLDNMGMHVLQRTHYELVARDGNALDLKARVEQEITSSDFAPPGLPPGTKVEIRDSDSSGEGNIAFDIEHIAPSHSEMSMRSKVAMDIEAMGQKQPMQMDMQMRLTIDGSEP